MIMPIKCCNAFISLQRSRSKTEPATATVGRVLTGMVFARLEGTPAAIKNE